MIIPFLIALFMVRVRDRDAPPSKRQPFLTEILDGARYAAKHPIIREAMILSGLFSLTIRGVLEILPAIADGVYQRGAEGLGQMLAVSGAGALVAAIFIALRRSGSTEATISPAAYATIVVGILCTMVLGLTANWYVALAMVFIIGLCLTHNGIDLQAVLQLALTDTYRGRVMGLWIVLVIGGAAISAIVLGSVADIFGMSATLIGTGIACAALVVSSLPAIWKGRNSAPPEAQ
jgi:hypothetical protein